MKYSDALVENAGHIRLQDVRLSYNLRLAANSHITNAAVFVYASNLGLIWKANHSGTDPDNLMAPGYTSYKTPKSIAIGFNLTLK